MYNLQCICFHRSSMKKIIWSCSWIEVSTPFWKIAFLSFKQPRRHLVWKSQHFSSWYPFYNTNLGKHQHEWETPPTTSSFTYLNRNHRRTPSHHRDLIWLLENPPDLQKGTRNPPDMQTQTSSTSKGNRNLVICREIGANREGELELVHGGRNRARRNETFLIFFLHSQVRKHSPHAWVFYFLEDFLQMLKFCWWILWIFLHLLFPTSVPLQFGSPAEKVECW